ncbi:RNA-binding domain-containing protein [Canariomyces notabilis]|uniref:RNA-binding domain-containing protein n=1 Tax=Canariomyces notabilis TaxID=2074819 RepID=A0AAN6QI68_9PEZI|nr:RNA-binding domain-containing protein [Canariomyces arenarius]
MSYPGPPGVSKPASHPSLPPRPPTTKLPGFKPAFSPAPPAVSAPGYTATAPSYPGYGAPATIAPPSSGYGAPNSASPYAGNPPATAAIGAGRGGYGQASTYNYPQQTYPQQPPYYGAAATPSYPTPPQIQNPFPAPAPASTGNDFDPEMAAQIAQWQSAYMPKDPNEPSTKPAANTGSRSGTNTGTGTPAPGAQAGPAETADAGANGQSNEKKKTVYREGGGKKWQDDTLLEWDPSHLRLFVGNLAGETTDDSLLKAFSRWKSVQKAKVIRDKRTTKSKGFGFVSFSDPEDFFQAAKEMNGKYIQSHPVVVRKAKTEIKPQVVKEDRNKGKNNKKGGGGNKSGSGMGAGQDGGVAYDPHLGPVAGGGIVKPGQKTKGGLKLLG